MQLSTSDRGSEHIVPFTVIEVSDYLASVLMFLQLFLACNHAVTASSMQASSLSVSSNHLLSPNKTVANPHDVSKKTMDLPTHFSQIRANAVSDTQFLRYWKPQKGGNHPNHGNRSGGILEAELASQCALWDPTCTINKSVAMEQFFKPNGTYGYLLYSRTGAQGCEAALTRRRTVPPSRHRVTPRSINI